MNLLCLNGLFVIQPQPTATEPPRAIDDVTVIGGEGGDIIGGEGGEQIGAEE